MSSNDPDPGRFDWDRHEREITSPDNPTPPDPDATAAVAERVADGERVLVDTPQAQRPARMTAGRLRAAQRRPIVPAMLRSRAELGESTRWAAGFVAHTSAYHLTRAPKYAGRLAFRAPRGGVRLLAGWLRWLFDLEGEPVRQASVNSQEPEVYLRLARQRDQRVRWRATLTLFLVTGVILTVAALALAPAWARAAACAALVGVLGVLGRPADRPLLDTAVVIPQAPG